VLLPCQVYVKNGWQVVHNYTTGPQDASFLAAEAVSRDVAVVIAVGGDGTVNEVPFSVLSCT
jgi:diacylglycerol kinase family enzyme